MAVAATGVTTIEAAPVAIFHRAVARSSWSSGCGERFWNGSTSRAGSAITDSGSQAALSSQNPRRTGSVEDAHNFDDASPHAIGDKISGLGNEQFARSRDATRTTDGGRCSQ